jgi:hypothetical protein
MPLKSKQFKGEPKLEACLISHPAHVVPGALGPRRLRQRRYVADVRIGKKATLKSTAADDRSQSH